MMFIFVCPCLHEYGYTCVHVHMYIWRHKVIVRNLPLLQLGFHFSFWGKASQSIPQLSNEARITSEIAEGIPWYCLSLQLQLGCYVLLACRWIFGYLYSGLWAKCFNLCTIFPSLRPFFHTLQWFYLIYCCMDKAPSIIQLFISFIHHSSLWLSTQALGTKTLTWNRSNKMEFSFTQWSPCLTFNSHVLWCMILLMYLFV